MQVFDEPVVVVCDIIQDALALTEPSIPQCIENAISGRAHPFICLLEIKEVIESIEKINLNINDNNK